MKKRNKRFLFTIFLFFLFCNLTSCTKKQEENTASPLQKIIIGIDKFEPYSYLDLNGEYAGIDIELANIVFQKLGYDPEFQFIPWNEKNTLLENGTIDCIWSCYSMNEREDLYEWAGPYLNSPQVIAVRKESGIYTFADLKEKRIGVQATTRAASLFLHDTQSDLPEVYRVNIFSTADDMFAAIRKGYVDAISGHEAVIKQLVTKDENAYRILSKSPHVSKAGVAFKKGTHKELIQKMNKQFKELTQDGTTAKIVEKYGLDASFSVIRGNDYES